MQDYKLLIDGRRKIHFLRIMIWDVKFNYQYSAADSTLRRILKAGHEFTLVAGRLTGKSCQRCKTTSISMDQP